MGEQPRNQAQRGQESRLGGFELLSAGLGDLWRGNCSLRVSPEQPNGSSPESFTAHCPQERVLPELSETPPPPPAAARPIWPCLKRIFNSFSYISDGAVSELAVSLFPHGSSRVLAINKFAFGVFIRGISAQDGQEAARCSQRWSTLISRGENNFSWESGALSWTSSCRVRGEVPPLSR